MVHDVSVCYLDKYKPDEEEVFRSCGLITFRSSIAPFEAARTTNAERVLFRGPRLSAEAYSELWRAAVDEGLAPVTSEASFKMAEDFALYYPFIRDRSPAAAVVSYPASLQEIAARIERGGLRLPLFVRSEVESAAKYVGVEGCIIHSLREEDIGRVVTNLVTHVKGFKAIIVKEMRNVRKTAEGIPFEYRAVGIGGRFLAFDFDAAKAKLPTPESMGVSSFVADSIGALAQGGMDGAVFVDVAIGADGEFLVVECKDFHHGSIGAPEVIAREVQRLAIA